MTAKFSPEFDSSLQILKDKLAALSAQSDLPKSLKKAALSMKAMQEVALSATKTAIIAAKNVDWDPHDHPRDPANGQFVKALTGFIWGKTEKAHYAGEGSPFPIPVVNFDLKPGDALWRTGANNALIAHADGTFTYYVLTGSHKGQVKQVDAGHAVANSVIHGDQGTKIAENKGVAVPTESKTEAKSMLKEPASFITEPEVPEFPTEAEVPPYGLPQMFKSGKTTYTAKQVAETEQKAQGVPLGMSVGGAVIKSGDWVEYKGKPYRVHASPYGYPKLTAYKWVATKQQAANLPQFNTLTVEDLALLHRIEDPTGKPYVPIADMAKPKAEPVLGHGSLMDQAVQGAVPSTSTAYKKYVAEHDAEHALLYTKMKDASGKFAPHTFKSGDWVEIEGKPYQVHASPNEGNIAVSKWVSTKQQASGQMYDFPNSVLGSAFPIPDPTGQPYKPLMDWEKEVLESADVEQVLSPPKEIPWSTLDVPAMYAALEAAIPGDYTYVPGDQLIKQPDGTWEAQTNPAIYTVGEVLSTFGPGVPPKVTPKTLPKKVAVKKALPKKKIPKAPAPSEPFAGKLSVEMLDDAPVGSSLLLKSFVVSKFGGLFSKSAEGWKGPGVGPMSAADLLPYVDMEGVHELSYPAGVKPPWYVGDFHYPDNVVVDVQVLNGTEYHQLTSGKWYPAGDYDPDSEVTSSLTEFLNAQAEYYATARALIKGLTPGERVTFKPTAPGFSPVEIPVDMDTDLEKLGKDFTQVSAQKMAPTFTFSTPYEPDREFVYKPTAAEILGAAPGSQMWIGPATWTYTDEDGWSPPEGPGILPETMLSIVQQEYDSPSAPATPYLLKAKPAVTPKVSLKTTVGMVNHAIPGDQVINSYGPGETYTMTKQANGLWVDQDEVTYTNKDLIEFLPEMGGSAESQYKPKIEVLEPEKSQPPLEDWEKALMEPVSEPTPEPNIVATILTGYSFEAAVQSLKDAPEGASVLVAYSEDHQEIWTKKSGDNWEATLWNGSHTSQSIETKPSKYLWEDKAAVAKLTLFPKGLNQVEPGEKPSEPTMVVEPATEENVKALKPGDYLFGKSVKPDTPDWTYTKNPDGTFTDKASDEKHVESGHTYSEASIADLVGGPSGPVDGWEWTVHHQQAEKGIVATVLAAPKPIDLKKYALLVTSDEVVQTLKEAPKGSTIDVKYPGPGGHHLLWTKSLYYDDLWFHETDGGTESADSEHFWAAHKDIPVGLILHTQQAEKPESAKPTMQAAVQDAKPGFTVYISHGGKYLGPYAKQANGQWQNTDTGHTNENHTILAIATATDQNETTWKMSLTSPQVDLVEHYFDLLKSGTMTPAEYDLVQEHGDEEHKKAAAFAQIALGYYNDGVSPATLQGVIKDLPEFTPAVLLAAKKMGYHLDEPETKVPTAESVTADPPGTMLYAKAKKSGTFSAYSKVDEKVWKNVGSGTVGSQDLLLSGVESGKFDLSYTPFPGQAITPSEPETEAAAPNAFVHPVSHVTFTLQPGDKVFKHKTTENGWVIQTTDPDTPIVFFNQYGKQYKPKAKQKNLDTAYEEVDMWPGKTEAPTAPTASSEVPDPLAEFESELPLSPPSKPKAKKKPKAKPGTLPKSYGGLNLQPKQTLLYMPGDDAYVIIKPGDTGYHPSYKKMPDGVLSKADPYAYYGPTADLKKNGEVVAEFKIPNTKLDLSEFTGTSLPEPVATFHAQRKEWMLNGAVSTYTWGNNPASMYTWASVTVDGNESTWSELWSELDSLGRLQWLAETYGTPAGQMLADFDASDLSGEDKKDVSDARKGLSVLYRFAVLARNIMDPDSPWSEDQFKTELAWLQAKAAKPGTAITGYLSQAVPLDDMYQEARKAYAERAFKAKLGDLPFDPYHGTAEDYSTYAAAHGNPYVAGLDLADQKNWVLNDLGAPNIVTYGLPAKIEAVKTKTLVASMAASLGFEQFKAPPAPPKVEGVYVKRSLYDEYHWGDSRLVHDDNDSWTLVVDDGSGSPAWSNVTDAVAAETVNNLLAEGTDFTHSDTRAYGDKTPTELIADMKAKVEADMGVGDPDTVQITTEVLNKYRDAAQARGCTNAYYLNRAQIENWLFAYAVGDQIGMWYWNNGIVGASNGAEAGNPLNPSGKAARYALAITLQNHPVGFKWLNGDSLSPDEKLEMEKWTLANYGLTWLSFSKSHDRDELKSALDSLLPTLSGAGPLERPASISPEVWALVVNSTPDTDFSNLIGNFATMPEGTVTGGLGGAYKAKNAGLTGILLPSVPMHLQRLAYWAASGGGPSSEFSDTHQQILTAIALKTKHGDFLSDTTPVWISPNGDKYPISPGTTVHKGKGGYEGRFMVVPPGSYNKSAYMWSGQGLSTITLYSEPETESWDEVFTLPGEVTYLGAKADGHSEFTEEHWAESEKVESGKAAEYTWPETGPILSATLKDDDVLGEKYPNLAAQYLVLPEHVRQAIAKMLTDEPSNAPVLAIMDYKASKSYYAGMQSKGLYDLSQPWLPYLSKGQTSEADILSHWSNEALTAYQNYFGLSDPGEVPAHLNGLLHPVTVYVEPPPPAWDDIDLTWTKKNLGGSHTKFPAVDQFGNDYMVKTFPNDPNAKARVDAEAQAIAAAQLYGFVVPRATARMIQTPGSNQPGYAYLQNLRPSKWDFVGLGLDDLSLAHLEQAMSHHVLDWMVSNHDAHHAHFYIGKDNKVFEIDLGQAFKFFPSDKLAVGYLPGGNHDPVWYDQFYEAVISGTISKEKADEVTKYVLRTAKRIAKDKDTEFRAILEEAFKNRTEFPPQFPTREKFIEALIERKHNLLEDFAALYKSIYAQSPYEWTIDLDHLDPPMLTPDIHVAVTTQLAEDIGKSAYAGKALFFHSPDLEDSYMLLSTGKIPDGQTQLRGEAKIFAEGDTALMEWFKAQNVENAPVVHSQTQSVPEPVEDYAELPMNAQWFSAIKQGAITVSHHNTSDGPEHYNTGTLAEYDKAHDQMVTAKAVLEAWKKAHPDEPWDGSIPQGALPAHSNALGALGFKPSEHHPYTMEQQQAWEQMLDTYLDYYQQVENIKNTPDKIKSYFQQVTYTPSGEALEEWNAKKAVAKTVAQLSDAEVGSTVDASGTTYVKQDDGFWVDPSGHSISGQSLAETIGAKPKKGLIKPPEAETHSLEMLLGSKKITVKYRPAAIDAGSIDFASGEMKLQGVETDEFQSGHMFEVDFGDVVITYRPWNAKGQHYGVALSQQGLLRIERRNWDGDPTSIDEILDVLRLMGLRLDPATDESMELVYWKMMYHIMRDRYGGRSGKWAEVHDSIQTFWKNNPNPTITEELLAFRAAWAKAIGMDKVKSADYLPKFSRFRPHAAQGEEGVPFTSGRPYWYRADFDAHDLQKLVSKPPSSTIMEDWHRIMVAESGAMLSTEERSRAYGKKATHGQSSGTDLGNGAGQVVYIHQNNVHGHAFYDPRILRRLHNYAFHYDGWGKQKYKSVQTHTDGPDGGAPWDINLTAPWDYGEVCVKNAASVLDDLILLIMDDEPTRQKAIKFYHDLGITETSSGIKIEDLFQTDSHLWQQNWKQAWKRALAEDKPLGYENLTDAQKDRYHYLVSTGVDPSEALHLAKQKKG